MDIHYICHYATAVHKYSFKINELDKSIHYPLFINLAPD
jgi:hypothetical protein